MDFLELARERFSVLEYEERPVEPEKVEQILEAARLAPTACNNQPQRILVIDSDELRARLKAVKPSRYYAPLAFLVCYDKTACWIRPSDGKASGEIDAAIAATHMMLEAEDLGLGSIWVMSWDPAKMKEVFALPEAVEPVALLIAGYRAPSAAPRGGHLSRKRAEDLLLR